MRIKKRILFKVGRHLEKTGEIEPILFTKWFFIGVGGCGERIVSQLAKSKRVNYYSANFYSIDSSKYSLSILPKKVHKISIGELGLGGIFADRTQLFRGREREIIDALEASGADACFLVTSTGGGTGSSITHLLAKSIKDKYKDMPVITLATLPFSHEPYPMFSNMFESIPKLVKSSDVLIVVDNSLFSEEGLPYINTEIIKIIDNLCSPKRYPYGKILDITDFTHHHLHSIMVPSLIQCESHTSRFRYVFELFKGLISNSNLQILKPPASWFKYVCNKLFIENRLVNFKKDDIKDILIYLYIPEKNYGIDADLNALYEKINAKLINVFQKKIPISVNFLSSFGDNLEMFIFYNISEDFIVEKMKEKENVDILIEVLQYPNPVLQKAAAKVLGDMGDAKAINPLEEALEDEDESVKTVAKEALEKIRASMS